MKPRNVVFALLVATCLLATPFFGACLVEGTYHYQVNWGHLKRPTPEGGQPNSYEAFVENQRCSAVQSMFSNQPGWNSWNGYGTDTIKSNLQSTIVWRQQNDVWATDFWVGDYWPAYINGWYEVVGWHDEYQYIWLEPYQMWGWWPVPVYGPYYINDPPLYSIYHQAFYGSGPDNSTDIYDHDVYLWTNYPYSKQMFTFDWTCASASVHMDPSNPSSDCYGYYDDQTLTGLVGMPLAWTSNGDMNIDGFNSPNTNYCYIGFDGPSFPLMQQANNSAHYYTDFVNYFYSCLLGYEDCGEHQSIHDALDFACNSMWADTIFQNSIFYPYGDGYSIYVAPPPGHDEIPPYGWYYNVHMQVIGNSAMVLP